MSLILYLILLLLAIPLGSLLSKLCSDEIKDWKVRFKIFSVVLIILSIITFFTNLEYKTPIIITFIFMIITFLTIIKKTK